MAVFAVTYRGVEWENRVSGYNEASFYVTPDVNGEAHRAFSADPYDVFLIDKMGRVVTSWSKYYDETLTPAIKLKIRQLNDE